MPTFKELVDTYKENGVAAEAAMKRAEDFILKLESSSQKSQTPPPGNIFTTLFMIVDLLLLDYFYSIRYIKCLRKICEKFEAG